MTWRSFLTVLLVLAALLCGFKGYVYSAEPSSEPLLRIETSGHIANISSAATSKDGRIVATSSADKTLKIWESGPGRLLNTMRVPIGDDREGTLTCVAMSPDGKFVATGGITGKTWDDSFSVYIFDVLTSKMVRRVSGVGQVVRSVKFSDDGKLLAIASGSDAGELLVVKADTGAAVARHRFAMSVESADFSSQGMLAVVTKDSYLNLFKSPTDSEPVKLRLSADSAPQSCIFNPQGTQIAVGYVALLAVSLVKIDGLDSKIILPSYKGPQFSVATIAWSRDGKHLYASGQPNSGKNKIIFTWSNGGHGAESRLLVPLEVVTRTNGLVVTARGDLFFAIGLTGVGEISADGKIRYFKAVERASFQKNHDYFAVSSDGATIRFSYTPYNQDRAAFNINTRTFIKPENIENQVFLPTRTTEFIDLQHWDSWGIQSKVIPRLNRRPLRDLINTREQPFSFGIAPDHQSFFVGTTGTLRKYTRFGKPIWRQQVPSAPYSLAVSSDGRYLVAGLGDGTIRWYSQLDGEEQIAFFPHPDKKRWVVWTPEGYFDASSGGSELVGYHINQGKDREAKFIPMSYLYDVFYRPDIIQARLKGDDIKVLITLTAEEALKSPPPEIRFTKIPAATSAIITRLCYEVKNAGGGIGELRLFQNGKLIRSDGYYRESAKREKPDKVQLASLNSRALYTDLRSLAIRDKWPGGAAITKNKGDLVDECVDIETISGDNEISLAAFNGPNTVQSFLRTAHFVSTRATEEPHLYILSVGIDRYRDTSINLKYAAKDAKDFIAQLPEKAGTIYKLGNIHLISLVNEQAGKHNILETIKELTAKVKHGDGFVFFNASHGVLLQNQYYIVTADYNGDLGNIDSLISSNEIVEISKQIKSLSQLFIFDTCHAGGVDNIVSGLYDARMSVLAKKMGLHIYASAGSVQTAMDGYKGNGLYTHTLLQGIANGRDVDISKSGKVTVINLGQYSKDKTTELSTKLGHPQTPLIINFGRDNPLFEVR